MGAFQAVLQPLGHPTPLAFSLQEDFEQPVLQRMTHPGLTLHSAPANPQGWKTQGPSLLKAHPWPFQNKAKGASHTARMEATGSQPEDANQVS